MSKLSRQWAEAQEDRGPGERAPRWELAQSILSIAPGQKWESKRPSDKGKVVRIIRITGVDGPNVTYAKIIGSGGDSGRIKAHSLVISYRRVKADEPDPENISLAVTPTLALESGERPGFPGSRVVIIRSVYGGKVTVSLSDWQALVFWVRNGELQ